MKRSIVVALLVPAALWAQEVPRQQGSPEPDEWLGEQRRLGVANESSSTRQRNDLAKVIIDIERKEQELFLTIADEFRQSDPQGLDVRFIRAAGTQRRSRLERDSASAVRLDSVRRTGNADELLNALHARHADLERFTHEADSLRAEWAEVLTRADKTLDFVKSFPTARERELHDQVEPRFSPVQRAGYKANVQLYERAIRLARAMISFEESRSKRCRSEMSAVRRYITREHS